MAATSGITPHGGGAARVGPFFLRPRRPPARAKRADDRTERHIKRPRKRAGRARPPPAVRRARPRDLPPGAAVGPDAACRRGEPSGNGHEIASRTSVQRLAGKYPSLQQMADDLHDAEVVEDANEEERLDPELAARRAAALAHVRKFGDPVLRSQGQADRASSTTRCATRSRAWPRSCTTRSGIGLAATQIGTLHRVLVYRVEHDSPVNALINPELEWSGKEKEIDRGGLPEPSRRPRRRRAAGPRPRPRAGRARRADRRRGVGPRGARHPARDGPPRRRPDPRPHAARPAQGGHARPARAQAEAAA